MPKFGNNVLFVDPPIRVGRVFFKYLLNGKWSLSRIFTKRMKTKEGVEVFSPLSFSLSKFISLKHARNINKISSKIFSKDKKTILWVYHVEIPGLENYLKNIKHDFLVYDCVDNYEAFPKYNTPEKRKFVADQEKLLVSRANIVFATTPGLVEKLKKHNPNTYFAPNVGDYERYFGIKDKKFDIPEDLKDIKHPIIAFTGAVDEYKFDRNLIRKVALDYPTYSFVIVGPMALKDKATSKKELGLSYIKNIYLLGTKEYADVPKYIAFFDEMIIPYQLNDYTVAGCFPVKFWDYLAAGLPVVVTDLPAYTPFADVCYISRNPNEFSQNIRRALEEDSIEGIKKRQLVAKENTWEGKVLKMLSLIEGSIGSSGNSINKTTSK
ncbi:MAG: glycosyltransferase [Patescibacteria group bacterium]